MSNMAFKVLCFVVFLGVMPFIYFFLKDYEIGVYFINNDSSNAEVLYGSGGRMLILPGHTGWIVHAKGDPIKVNGVSLYCKFKFQRNCYYEIFISQAQVLCGKECETFSD